MVDIIDSKTRSRIMSLIKGRDTRFELAIRKGLFKKSFRYRLYYKKLPGRPDIVLPKYKAIILLNGCFWHAHDCDLFKWPSSRFDFWQKKLLRNKELDQINKEKLLALGWRILTIWECSFRGAGKRKAKTLDFIVEKAVKWLYSSKKTAEIKG